MMDEKTEKFIAEGMMRYKQASNVLVKFGKEIESQLKVILNNRNHWGQFKPKQDAYAKSTTYWSAYPLLNGKLDGEFKGDKVKIVIAVNWFQSETDYPYYSVRIEPIDQYMQLLEQYEWSSNFEFKEGALCFYPNHGDFNLARDFEGLLDEFARFLNK
jgi:hypothetical protein